MLKSRSRKLTVLFLDQGKERTPTTTTEDSTTRPSDYHRTQWLNETPRLRKLLDTTYTLYLLFGSKNGDYKIPTNSDVVLDRIGPTI